MRESISPAFPFSSRYIDVLGSTMHYIDEGEGAPVVFLHGNPSSSYLWRNIIPYMTRLGRCIAPDLIGMGRSAKPNLEYRFADHVRYLDAFIEALDLRDVTLVVHDWGSALGFHYARRYQENVRAIAFMEAILKPMRWSDFPLKTRIAFRVMRSSIPGSLLRWLTLQVMNGFVKQVLPQTVVRPLQAEEMKWYGEPYRTVSSRKPLSRWMCQVPVDGQPVDVHQAVWAYNQWLQETPIPTLLFYANPGMAVGAEDVAWCKQHLRNLQTVNIGRGIHFLQEDAPHLIGRELARWYHRSVAVGDSTDGADL